MRSGTLCDETRRRRDTSEHSESRLKMDDIKRRTLLMWAEIEKKLSFPDGCIENFQGWADVMIELQLLREKEMIMAIPGDE